MRCSKDDASPFSSNPPDIHLMGNERLPSGKCVSQPGLNQKNSGATPNHIYQIMQVDSPLLAKSAHKTVTPHSVL
ncbi:hypothetical protein [Mangrovibacter phragmitis]|uniref:hypothetical protein n=1 Tax=Mangrovibacter phragmitis TaxID=1691903 RepID=UPI00336A4AAA